MRTNLKVYGYPVYGSRKTHVSLSFDEKNILLNPLALARSGMVGWGPWQSSKKVQTKWGPAWYVTTAGHGGYLMVTQTRETPFGSPNWSIDSEGRYAALYEFEEDCNWAILEYHDPTVAAQMVAKSSRSLSDHMKIVQDTMKNYCPEYLSVNDKRLAAGQVSEGSIA